MPCDCSGASGTNPSPLASRIYDDSHSSGTEEDLVEAGRFTKIEG